MFQIKKELHLRPDALDAKIKDPGQNGQHIAFLEDRPYITLPMASNFGDLLEDNSPLKKGYAAEFN